LRLASERDLRWLYAPLSLAPLPWLLPAALDLRFRTLTESPGPAGGVLMVMCFVFALAISGACLFIALAVTVASWSTLPLGRKRAGIWLLVFAAALAVSFFGPVRYGQPSLTSLVAGMGEIALLLAAAAIPAAWFWSACRRQREEATQ
jgi:hypothetical protein